MHDTPERRPVDDEGGRLHHGGSVPAGRRRTPGGGRCQARARGTVGLLLGIRQAVPRGPLRLVRGLRAGARGLHDSGPRHAGGRRVRDGQRHGPQGAPVGSRDRHLRRRFREAPLRELLGVLADRRGHDLERSGLCPVRHRRGRPEDRLHKGDGGRQGLPGQRIQQGRTGQEAARQLVQAVRLRGGGRAGLVARERSAGSACGCRSIARALEAQELRRPVPRHGHCPGGDRPLLQRLRRQGGDGRRHRGRGRQGFGDGNRERPADSQFTPPRKLHGEPPRNGPGLHPVRYGRHSA